MRVLLALPIMLSLICEAAVVDTNKGFAALGNCEAGLLGRTSALRLSIFQHLLKLGYDSGDPADRSRIEELLKDAFPKNVWAQPVTLKNMPGHSEYGGLDWVPLYVRSTPADKVELEYLIRWAPVWRTSPQAQEIRRAAAEKAFESWDDQLKIEDRTVRTLRWMLENAPREEHDELVRLIHLHVLRSLGKMVDHMGSARAALRILYLLPYAELPMEFRKFVEAKWLDFKTPTLRMSSVKSLHENSHFAGGCMYMFAGHVCSTLNANTAETPSALVRVNGVLIGAIKKTGDESLLSFRNVMDEQGRIVLAEGGVYRVSNSIVRKVLDTPAGHEINLPSIAIRPISFLLNESSKDSFDGWQSLLTIGVLDFEKAVILPVFERRGHRPNSLQQDIIWNLIRSRIRASWFKESRFESKS